MLNKNKEKASALFFTLIIVVLLTSLSGSYVFLSSSVSKQISKGVKRERCYGILQTSAAHSIKALNKRTGGDGKIDIDEDNAFDNALTSTTIDGQEYKILVDAVQCTEGKYRVLSKKLGLGKHKLLCYAKLSDIRRRSIVMVEARGDSTTVPGEPFLHAIFTGGLQNPFNWGGQTGRADIVNSFPPASSTYNKTYPGWSTMTPVPGNMYAGKKLDIHGDACVPPGAVCQSGGVITETSTMVDGTEGEPTATQIKLVPNTPLDNPVAPDYQSLSNVIYVRASDFTKYEGYGEGGYTVNKSYSEMQDDPRHIFVKNPGGNSSRFEAYYKAVCATCDADWTNSKCSVHSSSKTVCATCEANWSNSKCSAHSSSKNVCKTCGSNWGTNCAAHSTSRKICSTCGANWGSSRCSVNSNHRYSKYVCATCGSNWSDGICSAHDDYKSVCVTCGADWVNSKCSAHSTSKNITLYKCRICDKAPEKCTCNEIGYDDDTTRDDFHLVDMFHPGSTNPTFPGSNGVDQEGKYDNTGGFPVTITPSGNNKVYYLEGNLWVRYSPPFTTLIKTTGTDGTKITIIVKGTIFISDNLLYENLQKDAIALVALKDPNDYPDELGNPPSNPARELSGDIRFGDPLFGTTYRVCSYMYAENNFYTYNVSNNLYVYGNMTAGNEVNISNGVGSNRKSLVIDYDARIEKKLISLPGLPEDPKKQSQILNYYYEDTFNIRGMSEISLGSEAEWNF